jgi:hypothetical protein
MIRWCGEYSSPKNEAKVGSSPGGLNGRPKNDGRGIELMPFGPPESSVQLTRMTRMISPKPSVTMAR